jgi:hypothetical protein
MQLLTTVYEAYRIRVRIRCCAVATGVDEFVE